MEAKLLQGFGASSVCVLTGPHRAAGQARQGCKTNRVTVLRVHAALTRPMSNELNGTGDKPDIVYRDNWFDRLAIHHLSKSLQDATGLRNTKEGYDGLVEATRATSKNFTPTQQRELVLEALYSAFPKPILSLIRKVLPDSKFKREYFAVFTTLFFTWLIGPCKVKESEHNGQIEKNVVKIQKCRFLQESNCVGMCTNLCKLPSQEFIKESFGMPFNMIPNFEDMSCEMVFGQEPPLSEQDPALKQPCFKLCK